LGKTSVFPNQPKSSVTRLSDDCSKLASEFAFSGGKIHARVRQDEGEPNIVSRRTRFFFFEHVLLPIVSFPLRLWVKSWRFNTPGPDILDKIAGPPRLVIATYHGMLLQLLAFASLFEGYGRRIVVMTSPSYDGRLLGALLRKFGIESVQGSSRSRSIGGSLEFIRCIKAGKIGLIAVDGPRGPCAQAKPGVLKIAAAARAQMLLIATSAEPGFSFGTWDRAHLPAPFARVELALELLPTPNVTDLTSELKKVQELLLARARGIASPIVLSVKT